MSVEKARQAAVRAAFGRDIEEFLAGQGRGPTEAATRLRARDLRHYTTWLQGEGVPSSRRVSPDHLARYSQTLAQSASPATLMRRLDIVRAWHRFLSRERGYEDASRLLDVPRLALAPSPLLWPDDARVLLQSPSRDTLYGLRDRAMLHLLVEAGLSAAEICALRVGDYARSTGSLRVGNRPAAASSGVASSSVASRSRRVIARRVVLETPARQAMEEFLLRARPALWRECAARLRDKATSVVPRGCVAPLFPGIRSLTMSPSTVQVIVRQYARAAGLPAWVTPGSLRRTHEARLLTEGISPPDVARRVGRSAPSIARLDARLVAEQLRSTYRLAHPRA